MMKVAFLLGLLAFVAGHSSEEFDYSSEEYGSSEVSCFYGTLGFIWPNMTFINVTTLGTL